MESLSEHRSDSIVIRLSLEPESPDVDQEVAENVWTRKEVKYLMEIQFDELTWKQKLFYFICLLPSFKKRFEFLIQ